MTSSLGLGAIIDRAEARLPDDVCAEPWHFAASSLANFGFGTLAIYDFGVVLVSEVLFEGPARDNEENF
jgi:hypothetical protein